MRKSLKEAAEMLSKRFSGKEFASCTRRNGIVPEGWAVVDRPGYVRAIKDAGLPCARFWSGSSPTPVTKAPQEVVSFCRDNF